MLIRFHTITMISLEIQLSIKIPKLSSQNYRIPDCKNNNYNISQHETYLLRSLLFSFRNFYL